MDIKGKSILVRIISIALIACLPMASADAATKPKAAGRTAASIPNTILNGIGAPSNAVGIDGDFYIDVNNLNIYGPKMKKKWPAAVSLKGANGSSGTDGKSGNDGKSGSDGKTITNASTVAGPRGDQGIPGDIGPKGESGLRGEVGATGVQGIQGTKGLTGETGTKGDSGLRGEVGATGVQGIAGPVGVQGPIGLTGSIGLQGPTGFGSQGAPGATGATGAQGPSGATGSTGASGSGATGSPGPTGATGSAGATGSTGLQGAAGATGAAGSIGATGLQGATGAAGSIGAAGSTGIQGENGFSQATWVSIPSWSLATNVGGTPSDSNSFASLTVGKTYYVNISVHGVSGKVGGYLTAELIPSSTPSYFVIDQSVSEANIYNGVSSSHTYSFDLHGVITIGVATTTFILRVTDGGGHTMTYPMTLTGKAAFIMVGSVG